MKTVSQHIEWLSLIEVTGPFLAVNMLDNAFPQGLESVQTMKRQRLAAAYEEWLEAQDEDDPELPELHKEWVRFVLTEVLEYDDHVLIPGSKLNEHFTVGKGLFAPDMAVALGKEQPRLLVSIQAPGTDLESAQQGDAWPVSIIERMVMLCRESGVHLGLITNGERWSLINALPDAPSGHASWYARLWLQEPITLKAFQSLLGVRRCFGPEDHALGTLILESLKYQDEVTDTLGEQVRRAVEVLVQCLDKADEDKNRELLHDVDPSELYEAGLTVMMRLVFILSAEEQGLLLLGRESIYDQYYSISTLRGQLEEEADLFGPEVLDRRYDAWARLLTAFRGIYGGIQHERLRMPALGGSLFDPDRFPFLEGRVKGTHWTETAANPLPIDNRTVLLLLNSLQVLEATGGAVLLSYRALDVEQIGHVYEGLLEHTATRIPEVTLGLIGSQNAKNPNLSLTRLESALIAGTEELVSCVKEVTQRSESAIKRALELPVSEETFGRVLTVCNGDINLTERVKPFANLLRVDAWGEPIVYHENSFMITLGVDRRDTGTHYTPKSLTEKIVDLTLEPLVYTDSGPADSQTQFVLKSPADILALKICDPAMGSGAFLVQACRWIAEKLVGSWSIEESKGYSVTVDGEVLETLGSSEPMPSNLDERVVIARRLVAERCLYGVDVNPLAVELAKLSMWLITLAKDRPFGFLDHNFRHGDSLVGLYRLDQLTKLSLDPEKEQRLLGFFGHSIETIVGEVAGIRQSIRNILIRDVQDITKMQRLDEQSRNRIEGLELLADTMIREYLQVGGNQRQLELALQDLSYRFDEMVQGEVSKLRLASEELRTSLSTHLSKDRLLRRPFHWCLEFPEVFLQENRGFDAIIGNPPFMGGRRMRAALGDNMMVWFTTSWPHASLNADLCAFFYLRASMLLRNGGEFGLLATKTIGQGDTARTGLAYMVDQLGVEIRFALSSFPWPGSAAVTASLVVGHLGIWRGQRYLDECSVDFISAALDDQLAWGEAKKLSVNKELCYQGSVLRGTGFILTDEEARSYLAKSQDNQEVIYPYLNGEDINSDPQQKSHRWVIDFRDAELDECETRWPDLLQRIRLLVKPERDKGRTAADRQNWWRHWRIRAGLYSRIQDKKNVFVISGVTKYVAIACVSAQQIFSHAVFVLDLSSWGHFAALQCSFHELWVRRESSTMKSDIRYTPSNCFDTYPFFHINDDDLDAIGHHYYELRKGIMINRQVGLTGVYNLLHDPDVCADDIKELRDWHAEMDRAVARALHWSELELGHGFHDTKQGVRFTISEEASRQVIQNLVSTNHTLYEAQQKESLTKHGRKKQSVRSKEPNSGTQSSLLL